MTDDDDDLHDFDLSAWEPPELPAGLADAVVARLHAASPVTLDAEPRASRRWWIAGVAGGAVAAGAIAALIFVGGSKRAAPGHGEVAAARAQHLDLDTASADLDSGADVTWRRNGGELVVEQRRGAATWRVGDEGLRIDAKVASIEAAGASLRVEVQMQLSDARVIGASAAVSAAVSLATIIVYEGHVKVTSGGQTVNVEPGGTVEVRPGQPPGPPPLVVSAEDKLGDLQRQIAELEEQVQTMQGHPAPAMAPVSSNDSILRTLRSEVQACAADSHVTGTVNGKLEVLADGSVDQNRMSVTLDNAKGDGAEALQACVTAAIVHTSFPKKASSISFAEPIAPVADAGKCDEVSCVLNNYEGACCRNIKRAPVAGATGLGRTQISWGISYVKDRVMACGTQHPAKGIVKVHVKVRPDGGVSGISIEQTPDAELANCVAGVLYTAKFAKSDDGGSFSYPFVFDGAPKQTTFDFTAKDCNADEIAEKANQDEALGQHATALAQYEKAYLCKPSDRMLRLAFMAACNAGDVAKSRLYYKKLGTNPSRGTMAQMCVRAGIPIAMLEDANTSGFVTFRAKPQAKILIDGKDTGRFTPGTFELTPGKHKVTFRVGADQFTYPVYAKAGETTIMSKDLQ
jgi:hypothetical protein